MYADYHARRRIQPVSFGAALLINGAVFGALIFAVPQSYLLPDKIKDFTVTSIPEDKTPPPEPQKPTEKHEETLRETVIYQPPVTPTVPSENTMTTTNVLPDTPPVTPLLGTPEGTGDVPVVKEAPPPPLIAAMTDPRYARDFQPEYPGTELRGNREGFVSVRVKIGTDGRVKAVEQVSATSPAFFDATKKHALARWRFKPATRGGVAEESWKVMKVRFEMTGN